ncbi:hypothetical protein GW17_00035297 [Ensete ventricosum]|nr:hypothetical protein GW17_00035297 [Ensete ventricosum]
MNLSPSNLGANLSSASLLDPDPAASCFLDDPGGGGVGGGESSGRDGREGGGEDPSLLHLHDEIRDQDLPLRRRRTFFCGVLLRLPLPPALYGLLLAE